MEAQPVWVIEGWDLHFETYESRRLARGASWVAMSNKHDGRGYRRLIREADGVALYGAWCVAVQVASKMPVRGVLADLDGALVADDLEDKTGVPAAVMQRMMEVVAEGRIGWAKWVTDPNEVARLLAGARRAMDGRTRKRPHAPADDRTPPQTPAGLRALPANHSQTPADYGESAGVCGNLREAAGDAAPRVRAQADSTVQDSTFPPIVPQGGQANEHALGPLQQTAILCCGIFGRKNTRLSMQAEVDLGRVADQLPLSEEQQALLQWFYALPETEDEYDLSRRRNSADTLASNLFAEVDKAQAYAKKTGGFSFAKKNGAAVPASEPEGWREWFVRTYPGHETPPTWWALPEPVRSEFNQRRRGAA